MAMTLGAGGRVGTARSWRSPASVPLDAIRWAAHGCEALAAAPVRDRLVHHAEVVALKGDSYRLKDRDLGRVPTAATDE